MSLVFWDTMIFVYWIEAHAQFGPRVAAIHSRMREREDQLVTSALTIGELLAGAYSAGDAALARRYKEKIARPYVETIAFTEETAEHFARIRAAHAISPPDAIQLACAAQAKVDLFLTNDRRLAGKTVPGIQFIADLNFDYL
jgi:predicted nucleic acid-binding protein